MAYTWKEFNDEVRLHLPVDSDRLNAQDFIERKIRHAVIDIQGFIPRYRAGHEVVYCPNDFVTHNEASLGRLPEGAKFKEGYVIRTKAGAEVETLGSNLAVNRVYVVDVKTIAVTQGFTYRYTPGANELSLTNGAQVLTALGDFIATGTTVLLTSIYNTNQPVTAAVQRVTTSGECICGTHPVRQHPWDRRLELVDAQVPILDNNGWIAMDPEGSAFYLFPEIVSHEEIEEDIYSYKFRLHFNGKRLEFGDGDKVPFDERMANVVAFAVKADLVREVDRDTGLRESYRTDYVRERLNLYLDK